VLDLGHERNPEIEVEGLEVPAPLTARGRENEIAHETEGRQAVNRTPCVDQRSRGLPRLHGIYEAAADPGEAPLLQLLEAVLLQLLKAKALLRLLGAIVHAGIFRRRASKQISGLEGCLPLDAAIT
jgi:hypothetical protein